MSCMIGHETCQRLLPTKNMVEEYLKNSSHDPIVFLTPLVTDEGFVLLKETLVLLRKQDEVFVNDLGVLFFSSQKVVAQIFIGRILTRQLLGMLSIEKDSLIRQRFKEMFNDRIIGLEIDQEDGRQQRLCLEMGFQLRLCQRPKIISVTRRCVFNQAVKSLDKFAMCQKECLKNKIIAKNEVLNKTFVFSGNAIYMP